MQEPIVYQTFSTPQAANEVADMLTDAGIATEVIKNVARLDVIIGNDYSDNYLLKISPDDFNKANSLLFNEYLDAKDVDPKHPLQALTSDELKDVIAKPDEWGPENYSVALALLKHRGVSITDRKLAELKETRIEAIAEKQSFKTWLILVGYAFALLPFVLNALKGGTWGHPSVSPRGILWYFPGFGGLLIGLIILGSKTTLPDGRRIATYNDTTIKHGIAILALNILSWLVNIFVLSYMFAS